MKFESPLFDRAGGLLCGLGLMVVAAPNTLGEALSLRVADDSVPGVDEFFGAEYLPDFKGGIYTGLGVSANYDSNLFLSTTQQQHETFLEIEPWLAYRSDPDGGATASLELLYAPIARVFWDEPHLDSFDSTGSASFRFLGGKTDIRAYVAYAEVSGPDRLVGGYVSGDIFSYGLKADYQIASKTKILGSWRYAKSNYETAGAVGTTSYLGDLGFEWTTGRRLSLGASVQYSLIESVSTGEREAWALVGSMGYQVTDRIDLETALGIEFAENSRAGGGSDSGAIGRMKLTYRLSDRWRWNAMVRYRTVPSPGNVNYLVDDLLMSTSLTRTLHVGEIEGGVAYSISQYEAVGVGLPLASDNEKNLNLFLGYRRPFFSDKIDFSALVSYTSNRGLRDWNQLEVSLGLSSEF